MKFKKTSMNIITLNGTREMVANHSTVSQINYTKLKKFSLSIIPLNLLRNKIKNVLHFLNKIVINYLMNVSQF